MDYANERAQLHAMIDEAIASETDVAGIVVLVEVATGVAHEVKLVALLGTRADRLREILAQIRR